MADSSLTSVNYGRPGLTTYDLDGREWTFSRRSSRKELKQVAEWQCASPTPTNLLSTNPSANATTSRRDAKRLTHDYPQLAPSTRQLPELNTVSEAVTSAATTYDPLLGDLLSFGTIFLDRGGRPKRIAALPAGPSGNVLRLAVLGQQRHGWGNEKSVWLSGPSIKDSDSGYWNEDAVPIQQVCFAQAEGSNSFLAVRLPGRTVLFRPLYHRGRRAAKLSPYYDLPPSVISAHSILSLAHDETGGAPHADVTFNPDYQFQFGIIDQRYMWSIWQIERRAKRDEYSVTCLVRGNLIPEDTASPDDGDGWAKILWVGDHNTVLVCNRRHASLLSIEGETFRYLPMPPLVPQRSTDWILDVKSHPRFRNHFFVLTTTSLFVVAVTTSSASIDNTADQAGATILFSRRHYRGDEDLTLRLSVQTLADAVCCIFVHSCLNKLVQVYHLQDHSSGAPELVITSDPLSLDLSTPATAHIMHMNLDILEYGTSARYNSSSSLAHSYFERRLPFYQLSAMLSDLSVHQTVLLGHENVNDIEPIVWSKTVRSNHLLYTSKDIDELDDFIVPDGLDRSFTPGLKLESQTPRLLSLSAAQPAPRSMDYTQIYGALISNDQESVANKDSVSVDTVAMQLRKTILEDSGSFDLSPGYLMESIDALADVSDIDEASTKLKEFLDNNILQSSHVLHRIAPLNILQLPESEEPSIADLYDSILQEWIAPIPAEVSTRVRQAKERLARRVAAEVTLASLRLQHHRDVTLSQDEGNRVSLPNLPAKPFGVSSLDADMFPSSLPTPPPSSVPPSLQPPSSPSVPASSLSTLTIDPLSRLSKHLVVNNESLTPTVIPPSVKELLSHWQLGSDPHTYEWEATERALQPEAEDDVSQELREKERKRKERREKRQRREDELMRAKSHSHNQPTFPRSSPGPTFGGIGGSSQVPVPTSSQMPSQVQTQLHGFGGFGVFGGMPQSQVEPGRFGGRPDKKKKKGKSRVSGF